MVTGILRSARSRAAAVVGLATFVLLAGTGVAHASWTTAQQSVAGAATSASLQLSVAGDLSGQYNFAGNPSANPAGAFISRVVTLTNPSASTVALNSNFTLTATRTGGTLTATELQVSITAKSGATCPATATSGGSTLSAPVTYTAPTGSTIAPGASVEVCMLTKLLTTMAASAGKSIAISLQATAGYSTTSWSATSTAVASTQTVFAVTKPVVTCENADGGDYGLTLTWPMQSGATYQVFKNGSATPIDTSATSGETYTVQSGNNVGTGVTSLTVVGTVNGVSVSSNAIPIRYASVLLFFQTIRCNPEGTY